MREFRVHFIDVYFSGCSIAINVVPCQVKIESEVQNLIIAVSKDVP
jgi:hypothetical protein